MKLRGNELCPNPSIPNLLRSRIHYRKTETDPIGSAAHRLSESPARVSRNPPAGRDAETLKSKDRRAGGICALCQIEFTDYQAVVPDHKNPKGMGGAWRDDHPDNIQATHWWCNEEKGSTESVTAGQPESI